MAAAHVFVADLTAPELAEGDLHHLTKALRLRDGETVTASDGLGSWVPCRFVLGGSLEVDGDIVTEPPRSRVVTVAFAPVKGDRPEWAVQKLTELGVDEIVALACDRSVVRWDDQRAAKHLDRWRRVAREASVQSRRVWLPTISGVSTIADFDGQAGVAQADRGGRTIDSEVTTVLIGPEGGWSPEERNRFDLVELAGPVLRTETAALAAGVLLCAFQDNETGRKKRGQSQVFDTLSGILGRKRGILERTTRGFRT